MKNKWEFDKEYIQYLLDRTQKLLKSGFISKTRRENLKKDELVFTSFLNDDFSLNVFENNYSEKDLEQLIQLTLKDMKLIYKIIGPQLMDWIIELDESRIFKGEESDDKTQLSIDEQAEMTLKNYEKNSKTLLSEAKNLLYDTNQIQLVLDDEISSLCFNTEIINIPFIVVNPTEGPNILNHELQHGIEQILCYNQNYFYAELGSQFFELLFLDFLAEKNGYLKSGDFDFRFIDICQDLNSIAEFFLLTKEFVKKDFKVSSEEFMEKCESLLYIPRCELKNYLTEEILNDSGIKDVMRYVFSYLKAIELREKQLLSNEDALEMLDKYLKKRKFVFDINSDYINIYNKHVEEMYSRVRKK